MPEPAASPTADQRTVTVMGEGLASAVPDTALLQLGVETRGTTPAEALEACSHALQEVIAAVRAAGVEPPRLASGELSVHPAWEMVPKGQRPTGYRATAGLTARLDAPARAGQVASAAVAAGGGVAGCPRPGRAVRRAGGCGAGPGRADRGGGRRAVRAAARRLCCCARCRCRGGGGGG